MRKLWLVVKREYMTRVVSKGFVISTIAIPAVLVAMIVFGGLMGNGRPTRPFRIALLDETGGLGKLISANLAQYKLPGGEPEFELRPLPDLPASPQQARDRLDRLTRTHVLDGYLWIPADISAAGARPELVESDEALVNSRGALNNAITQAVIATRLRIFGITPQHVGSLLHPADVRIRRLAGNQRSSEDKGQGYVIAIVMASILYGALLMYGITTMRSVLEEKTTRTMEVLTSSIRPVQLMAGKILGVAAVGLTQFLIWAVSAGLILAYAVTVAHAFGNGHSPLGVHISPLLLACFVIFFMGGYFLFASMYAAIGAVVSDQNDAQQLQMPITFLLVASFFLFGVIASDPSSTASVILTLIPFFSPILMVFRVALETPPLWQLGLSIGILLVTTAGVVYVTARIYRVGVLMYGKRPSLIELFRWMRYS